jgi:ParB family chromosome partitioning protein
MTCSPEVKGKISINFSNEDELEFVMQVFDKVKKSQK